MAAVLTIMATEFSHDAPNDEDINRLASGILDLIADICGVPADTTGICEHGERGDYCRDWIMDRLWGDTKTDPLDLVDEMVDQAQYNPAIHGDEALDRMQALRAL